MSDPVDIVAVEMASEVLESSLEDEDWMTQSQFAQVVFMDVADNYPNDCDLLCRFSLNEMLEIQNGDRVGIYRVPHISPHEYLTFQWIGLNEDKDKKDIVIEFKGSKLPKEDDIYQYQYIRGDNSVLGASIPFHLRKPKSEELCAVEDDEEFMVVRSNTSLVSEQYKDRVQELEQKYSELLSLSEKLNDDLEAKSQSFVLLDEQLKSLTSEKAKFTMLKEDLAMVLSAKVELEKKLHKSLESLDKMTTKMEKAISEKDDLLGRLEQSEQEKKLYQTEAKQTAKKAEDINNMLMAMTKSKEMAVDEIKEHILQKDKISKQLEKLKVEINDLKLDHLNLKEEKKKIELDTNETIQTLCGKILAKDQELDELRKYAEVLELKAEALQLKSLDNVEVQTVFEREEPNYETLYKGGQDRIANLEKMLKDLQESLKNNAMYNSEGVGGVKNDIEMLRSRSLTVSETSSAQNMDSLFIRNAIETASATANDKKRNSLDVTDQALDLSLKQKSENKVLTQQPKSSKSFEDENLQELFDWATSSSSTNQPLNAEAVLQSGNLARANDPQTRSAATNQRSDEVESETSINRKNSFVFTDDGRLVEVEQQTDEEIEKERKKPALKCPICDMPFELEQEWDLQFHVDSHLTTSSHCPVCDKRFEVTDARNFEKHVQEHFETEDFSVVDDDLFQDPGAVARRNQGNPLYQHLSDQQQENDTNSNQASAGSSPFDFVGNVVTNVTNSVRRWNLDID